MTDFEKTRHQEFAASFSDRIERHQRIVPIIATAVALLIGMMMLEFICRLLVPSAERNTVPTQALFTEYDPLYGWRLKKNYSGPSALSGPDRTTYSINSLGYRGAPMLGSLSMPRVLVVGETTGFGLGVEEWQMFSQLLADDLRRVLPNVEMVNLSVPGYSLDQELLVLENEAKRYQPTVVILLLSTDSIYSIQYPGHRMLVADSITDYAKPYFVLAKDVHNSRVLTIENQPPLENVSGEQYQRWEQQYLPPTPLGVLGKYLKAAKYLDDSLKYINTEHFFGRPEVYPAYSPDSTNWQLMLQLLYRFKDLSRTLRSFGIVAIIPAQETYTMTRVYPLAHYELKNGCIQVQLQCIDLLNPIQSAGGAALYAAQGNYLNQKGQVILKDALKEKTQAILMNRAVSQ